MVNGTVATLLLAHTLMWAFELQTHPLVWAFELQTHPLMWAFECLGPSGIIQCGRYIPVSPSNSIPSPNNSSISFSN
jgi:hypothetical protein